MNKWHPQSKSPTSYQTLFLYINSEQIQWYKRLYFTKISLHFVLNYSIPQSNFTTQSSLHQTANRVSGGWWPEPKQATALNTKARNWSIATEHLVHDIQVLCHVLAAPGAPGSPKTEKQLDTVWLWHPTKVRFTPSKPSEVYKCHTELSLVTSGETGK